MAVRESRGNYPGFRLKPDVWNTQAAALLGLEAGALQAGVEA